MTRTLLLALTLALLPASGSLAQEPDAPPKPASAPARAAQPVNIQIDLTLTEEGEGAATPKAVTMLVADGELGRIRTGTGVVALNVDARPSIVQDGLIRVMFSLQYGTGPATGQISQSLNTLLTSGKPLVVSHSADPRSNRRVRAELTATILR